MRTHAVLLLVLGLAQAACQDSAEPSTVGTLVVSTASSGNTPDRNGYLLTVDGVDSLRLDPTGTSEIDLPAGRHRLLLLGMAEHCLVSPATSLDVGVPSRDTTSVAFEVTCSVTGVRITTTTTGLDFDTDGYRVEVDGIDQGILPSSGNVLTRLEPGSRTIALGGLSPNCTLVGPRSHTVTILASEIATIAFATACTATSGVIGVVVEASGTNVNGEYKALVDGASPFTVLLSRPGYLAAVAAGDHVVSLVGPVNCSVATDPQPVTVTGGGLIRDTVEVTFSVICEQGFGTLRITVPTGGPLPNEPYQVAWCEAKYFPIMCGNLGDVAPNDTLVARVSALERVMFLHLRNIPANCRGPDPIGLTLAAGDTLNFKFPVRCWP